MANEKRALITGITGQDGSYLAELLLEKGYRVWGMVRRSSSPNTSRIDSAHPEPRLQLCHGDLTDSASIGHLLAMVRPDEVYNLGSQSQVNISFEIPEYTANVTGLGAVRLLEALREQNLPARYFQAASSEMFGQLTDQPQDENTPFHPRSPYAAAKVFAFHMTRNYREAHGMFAVNGLLFNHESPRRDEAFVSRKITRGVADILRGKRQTLHLGNLDSRRDWGFAGDYVEAMWQMLQAPEPDDYVIATGVAHSVRDFCQSAFEYAGLPLRWQGTGLDEVGYDSSGTARVRVDPRFFRPSEVGYVRGNAAKAKTLLGWQPRVSFQQLVQMMMEADLATSD